MLVVTANWGLGDGTLPGPAAMARAVLAALERAVLRAGMGADGRYRPVERVDVVLAGDTLDMLVSDEWSGTLRPWQGGARAAAARTRVAARALDRAADALAPLVTWARHGLPVPAADPRGRPSVARRVAVPLRVTLLAGDRDPWLAVTPLPRAWQGWSVAEEWTDDGVAVRHGHDLDPLCHAAAADSAAAAGRPPTLGESVAVDLLLPWLRDLRRDATAWRLTRPLLRDLSAARAPAFPGLLTAWLATVDDVTASAVESRWRGAVTAWLREARHTVPGCEAEFDALEALAGWLVTPRRDQAAARPEPLPPAAPGQRQGGTVEVLGHPSAVGAAECRVVRIGPAAPAAGNARHATAVDLVVHRRHGGRPHWECLAGGVRRGPVVAVCGSTLDAGGGAVVDAA